MRWPVLAAAVVLAAATGLRGGDHAAALAPVTTGWWVKQGAPQPQVPARGMLVAQDATSAATGAPGGVAGLVGPDAVGPTAISAVRITGVSDTGGATLTLQTATGSALPPAAVVAILACPMRAILRDPPQGGSFVTSPAYDCAKGVPGRVSGDLSSVSWLLPASLQLDRGELDVVLVPDPAGPAVVFSTAFQATGSGSVEAAAGAPPPPAPAAAPVPPQPTPAVPSARPAVPSPATTRSGAGGVAALAPPSPQPQPPLGDSPSPAVQPAAAPAAPPVAADLPGTSNQRILAAALLVLTTVSFWLACRRPAHPPQLLGGAALRRRNIVEA